MFIQNLSEVFPKKFNKSMNFASRSSDLRIHNFLKSGLKELRNKLKNSNEANMLSIINTISKTENYIQGLDNKYS